MSTTGQQKTKDTTQMILEETERRLDTYYEVARPGEEDSPIAPMTQQSYWLIGIVAIALVALWLIGRFVILPIYV
jgi:hypothetical protein